MARVNFLFGETVIESEWGDTETAGRLLEALPLEASGNYWGGEFYFSVPVQAPAEENAREVVEPGTVAFWVEGSCLCLFWGATPVSHSDECRAASKVNIVGRVMNPELLPGLKGRKVKVVRGG
jgi:hypothetical protein